MILTNTRTAPLCKIQFGFLRILEMFHCVKFGLILANDKPLSFEIRFDLTKTEHLKEL